MFLLGHPEFVEETYAALREVAAVVGTGSDLKEALGLMDYATPGVVLVDYDLTGRGVEDGIAAGEKVAEKYPETIVILACSSLGFEKQRKAKARGIRNLVKKPVDPEEFLAAVEEAREEEEMSRRRLMIRAAGTDDEGDGSESGRHSSRKRRSGLYVAKQEVIVFYSPKGGVGKTTLAVNLAALFARAGLRVAVIDFDVRANVGIVLDIRNGPRLDDWVSLTKELLDRRTVEGGMVRHPAGMWVLLGLRRQIDGELLDKDLAAKILEAVRRCFDVVVVDVGPELRDSAVIAFDNATRIFLVSTFEKPAVKAAAEAAKILECLPDARMKMRLVLNRVPQKPDWPPRAVAELLNAPLVARIPEDPSVRVLMNRGEVPIVARPDGPFAAELRKLAEGMIPLQADAERRRGLLARLFGRLRGRRKPERRVGEEAECGW